MNNYPLIYKHRSGITIRFRKLKDGVYEDEHGRINSKCKMNYKFTFVKDERTKEFFETTVNGFRVRRKFENI